MNEKEEPRPSQGPETASKEPETASKEPKASAQPQDIKKSTAGQEEEPYNPFIHRNVKKPTSDFEATAHMLKTSLGSGILAMPLAFKNSGLVFGTIGSILLGITCTHCVQMLIRSSHILCVQYRVPTLTFAQTTEKAFLNGPNSARKASKSFGIIVTVLLLASFTLGNTVYVVFIAETMTQVCKFFWNVDIHIRYFTLMLWIPLILMCMIPNLKGLAPFSVVANILVLVSFCIVVYYIVKDIQPTTTVNLIAPLERLPMFLCTIVFAIEGIGTVLTIENEMKNPQHFIGGRCGVVYIAMTIVIVVYTIIGFLGYLQYGESTKGSVTLNLPVGEILGQSVKIMIGLAIFFTYALQFYVPINLIYDMLKDKVLTKKLMVLQIIIRVTLVSGTIILALLIPNLEPIIGVVGAICFSTLGLLIPALIDIMVRSPNFGGLKWRLYKNVIIMIISVITLVCGLSISLIQVVRSYQ